MQPPPQFGALLDRALKLGCGFLATGHYARVEHDGQGYHLLKGVDAGKDQSYFLFGLTQQRLAHVLFPLGGLHKDPEVRAIAERLGLTSAHKRDSEGICFVPGGNHLRFIEQRTGRVAPAGDILDTDGNVIGRHEGALRYTLGQRKGLGVACARPVYVCAIDTVANTVTLGGPERLMARSLVARDWNWVAGAAPEVRLRAAAKVRYHLRRHAAARRARSPRVRRRPACHHAGTGSGPLRRRRGPRRWHDRERGVAAQKGRPKGMGPFGTPR